MVNVLLEFRYKTYIHPSLLSQRTERFAYKWAAAASACWDKSVLELAHRNCALTYFMRLLRLMMRKVRPSEKAVEKSLWLPKPCKNQCEMEG